LGCKHLDTDMRMKRDTDRMWTKIKTFRIAVPLLTTSTAFAVDYPYKKSSVSKPWNLPNPFRHSNQAVRNILSIALTTHMAAPVVFRALLVMNCGIGS
jgi:hypothetical protein